MRRLQPRCWRVDPERRCRLPEYKPPSSSCPGCPEVRAAALQAKQRRVVDRCLIDFARVLRNEFANHLQMAEFLYRNVLQHITDASILDVKGLRAPPW